MLGVTKISVAKTLTGNPTQQTLEKIATALDIPMWQLFANPEEVGRAVSKGPRVRCPHCGEEIPVHIDIRQIDRRVLRDHKLLAPPKRSGSTNRNNSKKWNRKCENAVK